MHMHMEQRREYLRMYYIVKYNSISLHETVELTLYSSESLVLVSLPTRRTSQAQHGGTS